MTLKAPLSASATSLLRAWWIKRNVLSDMCNLLNPSSGVAASVSVIFAVIAAIPAAYEAHSMASMSMLNIFFMPAFFRNGDVETAIVNRERVGTPTTQKETIHV